MTPHDAPDRREEASHLGAISAWAEDAEAPAQLIRQMGANNWRTRQAAIASLTRRGGEEAIGSVLALMHDDHRNLSVLNSAIQVLTRSGMDTLSGLRAFLQGPDRELRSYAAIVLGEQNNPSAIPDMLRALGDADANVRYHAIEALGKLRAASASQALAAIAESRDFCLAFPALTALASIGDSSVAHRIAPLLDDPLLQSAAIETLGQLGDEAVVPPLAALLNDSNAPIGTIACALGVLYGRYEEMYREGKSIAGLALPAITAAGRNNLIASAAHATERELKAIALVIGWLPGADADAFLAPLLSRPDVRAEIADILVQRGAQAIDSLIAALNGDDVETQCAAALALGRIGSKRALPALVAALGIDNGLTVAIAGALAMIGAAEAYVPLRAYLGHPRASVRQAAVAAVNAVGHTDLAGDLIRLLNDANPAVRESAIKIAAYVDFPECAELLLPSCRDAQENVRCAAVECLAHVENGLATSALLEALRDPSPRVRATAARTLGQSDVRERASGLEPALGDPDPWVRYFAARACGRHGNPHALAVLRKLARDDHAMQVRVAAVEAIGRGGGREDIDELALLAESPKEDLARAAIAALGFLGLPEALPPLVAAAVAPESPMRIDAVRALGNSGKSEAVKTLRQAAVDPDANVVQAAFHALSQLANAESIDALVELCAAPQLRDECISRLGRADEMQVSRIARGLSHEQLDVRRSTVAALGRLPYPTAEAYLRAAAEDAEASVRFAAIGALSHSRRIATIMRSSRSGESTIDSRRT